MRTDGNFGATSESGTWNGVWTRKISGNFDYNPDAAMPADPSWANFIAAVFTNSAGPAPTVDEVSYEFDYYLPCAPADERALAGRHSTKGRLQRRGDDRRLLTPPALVNQRLGDGGPPRGLHLSTS